MDCLIKIILKIYAVISNGHIQVRASGNRESWSGSCLSTSYEFGSINTDFRYSYEGCSNMNASSFITFFTHKLRQYGKRFYKGLYVTFKLAPVLKKNTVHLSSYNLLKGHVSILTNSMFEHIPVV